MTKNQESVTKAEWLQLSAQQRKELRLKFNIRNTEDTFVLDDRVMSDGVGDDALKACFSLKALRKHFNVGDQWPSQDWELQRLWTALVAPENPVEAKIEPNAEVVEKKEVKPVKPVKLGKKKTPKK